jgi:integrase
VGLTDLFIKRQKPPASGQKTYFDTDPKGFGIRISQGGTKKLVWRRAEEVGYPYGTIVQLLILTGQRRGEIAALRASWIDDESITFPARITKNGREHRIPLGSLTKEIIESVPGEDDLLFPARGKTDTAFSGWSKAKR